MLSKECLKLLKEMSQDIKKIKDEMENIVKARQAIAEYKNIEMCEAKREYEEWKEKDIKNNGK